MKLILENWRSFLTEQQGPEGGIIFYGDNVAIIGVSHGGGLERQFSEPIKQKLGPIAKLGFYCEGRCQDTPKLEALMQQNGLELGPSRGQFDKTEEIQSDKINWAYTLFTGGGFESKEWPEMILGGNNDGSIPPDAFAEFQSKKDKNSGDVIKLMLMSPEFGPEGLGGLNLDEAERVLGILRQSGVNIDVPAQNIVKVMKQAHLTLFPGSGDIESDTPLGKLSKAVQGQRRALLMQKLQKTGGIGLIGYSHLVNLVKEFGGKIV